MHASRRLTTAFSRRLRRRLQGVVGLSLDYPRRGFPLRRNGPKTARPLRWISLSGNDLLLCTRWTEKLKFFRRRPALRLHQRRSSLRPLDRGIVQQRVEFREVKHDVVILALAHQGAPERPLDFLNR